MESGFELLHTTRLREIKEFRDILKKKEDLESKMATMIRNFEDETGVAVDLIKYQRDLTLPIKRSHYITLSIKLSQENLENW